MGPLMETYDSSLAKRFGQLLDQRERELRAILSIGSGAANTIGEDAPHEVMDFKDVATEQSQDAVDDAKKDHAALELEQVLAAHRRLHDGSYGNCLNCGNPIDLRRLTTLPAAPLCISCQTKAEHEAPHTG
jgi:DnaK suppressor protein